MIWPVDWRINYPLNHNAGLFLPCHYLFHITAAILQAQLAKKKLNANAK